MKPLTREEQKALLERMAAGHREVERLRRAELRGKPYDWREVDELLKLADNYDGPPRLTSGLVDMQRIFMRAHPKLKRNPGGPA